MLTNVDNIGILDGSDEREQSGGRDWNRENKELAAWRVISQQLFVISYSLETSYLYRRA